MAAARCIRLCASARPLILACAAAISIIGSSPKAQAGPIAYAVGDLWTVGPSNLSSTNWFTKVDLATGELTPIARVLDPLDPSRTMDLIDGIDFDPVSGRLYAVTGAEELFELDPATGQVVGSIITLTDSVTGITLNKAGYGLSFAPDGTLYVSAGSSGRFFGTVDKATGIVTQLLNGTPAASAEAIAVHPNGRVFGTEFGNPGTRVFLVEFNPADGTWTSVGILGDPMNNRIGLDFDASGQLWGIERGGIPSTVNSTIFLVDPLTGARTTVWTPTDPVTGLQLRANSLAVFVPEPACLVLLASALAAFGAPRWLTQRATRSR
jgi:hypothetical protein